MNPNLPAYPSAAAGAACGDELHFTARAIGSADALLSALAEPSVAALKGCAVLVGKFQSEPFYSLLRLSE